MAAVRDWQRNRQMWIRVLEKQTGEGLEAWNRRIARQHLKNEASLRAWLPGTGERLRPVASCDGTVRLSRLPLRHGRSTHPAAIRGPPPSPADLRRHHRNGSAVGEVTIQARKTFVSSCPRDERSLGCSPPLGRALIWGFVSTV